ncbi:MAG: hypothetical protein P1U68_15285 [Verrucomicrobiales bacterium]|nr:hypothetical protein [Verrucomicrobiales bacterium]
MILNFSGSNGSDVVTWEATGAVTVSSAAGIPAFSTGVGAAPVGDEWATDFDNNIGDVIQDGQSDITNVSLGGLGISYQKNGTEFFTLTEIDFNSGSGATDDIQPDFTGSDREYPNLADGDIVSWVGSGTLSLGGTAFDDYFNVGSYSSPINGGFYTVNISLIPEPSSVVLFSMVFAGFVVLSLRGRRAGIETIAS